jgi:hypothetical protein
MKFLQLFLLCGYLVSGNDIPGWVNAATAMITAVVDVSPAIYQAFEKLFTKLPNSTFKTTKLLENYVPRPVLEGKIRKVYESKLSYGSDSFTIVAGPKGAGKSTAIEHVLKEKLGVVRLGVSQVDTEKSILSKLLFSGGNVEETGNLDIDVLAPGFWAAADQSGGRRITVVLEVERGTASDGVLYMVKATAKKLACFANVMVVLSEANAALMFGDDPRHDFIWVEGMTNEEATHYAKKVFPDINDAYLGLFIDKVCIIGNPYKTRFVYCKKPHSTHSNNFCERFLII